MEYSKEQLNKIFDSLPDELKTAIMSIDTFNSIVEISNKYKLHIDQQSFLGIETGNVLLGVTNPMDFVGILSSRLGIDKNITSQIVGEINDKIFVKVRESLRTIHSSQKIGEQIPAGQRSPDLMKTVETEKLNVPKQAMDVLQGKVLEEKKKDTSILGFQTPTKPMGQMNVLEEKMKTGFSIPGEEIETEEKRTMGKIVDPYKEAL